MTEQNAPSPQRDSTRLYANKAQIYAQSRPDYAPEAYLAFQDAARLPRSSVVLDAGSGTGMSTRHLLDLYSTVYALEPAPEMRRIAEAVLGDRPGFHSLDGRAEDIPLPDNCVDLIVVGQAIHWFQPEAALAEFQRIAVPNAWLLIAHIRSLDEALNQALESLFTEQHGLLPRSQRPPSDLVSKDYYFAGGEFESLQFPHTSLESWECFLGGMLSAAYAPDGCHPLYEVFVQAAREIFDRFSQDGTLTWNITTEISFGRLTA